MQKFRKLTFVGFFAFILSASFLFCCCFLPSVNAGAQQSEDAYGAGSPMSCHQQPNSPQSQSQSQEECDCPLFVGISSDPPSESSRTDIISSQRLINPKSLLTQIVKFSINSPRLFGFHSPPASQIKLIPLYIKIARLRI